MNSCRFSVNSGPSYSFSSTLKTFNAEGDYREPNFKMLGDTMMLSPPQVYQFDNSMIGYPPSQSDYSHYADIRAVPKQCSHIDKPKSRGVKRVRTHYTLQQIMELEREFDENVYLSKTHRFKLSRQLCLTEKQIKVWFQNRRTKNKKGPASSKAGRKSSQYKHPSSFNFDTNSFAPNFTFDQPISDPVNIDLPASQELLNMSDIYLPELDCIPEQAVIRDIEEVNKFLEDLESVSESCTTSENSATTSPRNESFYFTGNNQIDEFPELGFDTVSFQSELIEL